MTNQADGNEQTSGESRLGIRIDQVLVGPPHEGDAGEGLVIRTTAATYAPFCTPLQIPSGR